MTSHELGRLFLEMDDLPVMLVMYTCGNEFAEDLSLYRIRLDEIIGVIEIDATDN